MSSPTVSTPIADRARIVRADLPQGKQLRMVPILGPSHTEPDYRVLDQETLPKVSITEISNAGSVPDLLVHNPLPVPLLLIDGQELVGAKQNRILNADVLVPAETKLVIPVSCVESHRWRHLSAKFSSGHSASHHVRSSKMASVTRSLKREGKHYSDQAQVWNDVEKSLTASAPASPTRALSDGYAACERALSEFRNTLNLPTEAVGVGMFHGQRLCGIDLFDRHQTLNYFFSNLIDSYAIDWLHEPVVESEAAPQDQQSIREALDRAAGGKWDVFPSPGAGVDHRMEDDKWSASALVWEERVVIHLQLLPRG
jgi:hypothetical protein